MSIAGTNQTAIVKSAGTGWLESLSRRMVFRTLQSLPRGALTIEEGGEVYEFGDRSSSGQLRGHIVIRDPSAYRDILFGGSIGAGEAYTRGSWASPRLVDVIRVMAANIQFLNSMDASRSVIRRFSEQLFHRLRANTKKGARKNISAHYDLGNEFFELFLDSSMMYSSAIFPTPDTTLDEASIHKLDTICKKLALRERDHLIEIGTGWGGMAIHAASHYGCRVTTTTISREQYEYARAAVADAGLEDRVTVLLEDYRNLSGKFDKLVSIEMIEAVGHEYYDSYFEQCSRLLKRDGLMLIQAITIPDQRYQQAKNSVDFIQRYIFPGGCLPSNAAIVGKSANTDLQLIDMQDIGRDYARTLAEWRARFMSRMDDVRCQGFDEAFCRMWDFYLCYCEGGFTERAISTSQFLFARPDAR